MKFLILILSCDSIPEYKELRELSRIYYTQMSNVYDIRHFYIESKEDLETEIQEIGDRIITRGKDSIVPGIFVKTMKALEYVQNKYEYEYIIRTNLSSFWNIHNLMKIYNTFNKSKLTGILINNYFISGTGIILSNDIARLLLDIRIINPNLDNELIHDDVFISKILSQYIILEGLPDHSMYYLTEGSKNVIPEDISDILYFRVKNDPDRSFDVSCFKQLLKRIYNIEV